MNSLSWMIYVADVAGTVKTTCSVFLIGTLVVFVVLIIFAPLIASMVEDFFDLVQKAVKPALITIAIVGVVNVVTPSTNTIYAIAASELGEEALKSSTATKAQQALDAWLEKQIEQPEQP
jgi:ABC-type transport system involved in cytochrome bd biosynthesis fused ATPase/permease subunit